MCYMLVSILFHACDIEFLFFKLKVTIGIQTRLYGDSASTSATDTPKFHQHYYYTFGAYQAFRRIYSSDERSTSIKMAVEDMDAMLCSSLRQLKPEGKLIHFQQL